MGTKSRFFALSLGPEEGQRRDKKLRRNARQKTHLSCLCFTARSLFYTCCLPGPVWTWLDLASHGLSSIAPQLKIPAPLLLLLDTTCLAQ